MWLGGPALFGGVGSFVEIFAAYPLLGGFFNSNFWREMSLVEQFNIPDPHLRMVDYGNQFAILGGGRIKMSGSSPQMFFEGCPAGDPLESHEFVQQLQKNPVFGLLLSFFPDEPRDIKRRIRGAGLYRSFRMDQGPGGNFTNFSLGTDDVVYRRNIQSESGFVVVEEMLRNQITEAPQALIGIFDQVRREFELNNYRKTAMLTSKLVESIGANGFALPENGVGSRNGLFFIRPVDLDEQMEVGPSLYGRVNEKVYQKLSQVSAKVGRMEELIKQGVGFDEAFLLASETALDSGEISDLNLLYFQPDCFVDSAGNVEIEKINFPDVGMFLTMLDSCGNSHFDAVKQTNLGLRKNLLEVMKSLLSDKPVVIVTRDEVIENAEDTLELLEIQALQEMLGEIGLESSVVSVSEEIGGAGDCQLILLNIDSNAYSYSRFCEMVVQSGIECFPNPLVKAFEVGTSTFDEVVVDNSQGHLDVFMNLVKPKGVNASNADSLMRQINRVLDLGGVDSDLMYVEFAGLKTPLPVFRRSLHSLFQIYNAAQKVGGVDELTIKSVPFDPDRALIFGDDGARLAAIRFFGVGVV